MTEDSSCAAAPLLQLTPVIYQAELAQSAAEAQRAQVEPQNVRMIRENNVVSANDLALAQASLDRAAAERALASVHPRSSRLDAPFDGIAGRLMARRAHAGVASAARACDAPRVTVQAT